MRSEGWLPPPMPPSFGTQQSGLLRFWSSGRVSEARCVLWCSVRGGKSKRGNTKLLCKARTSSCSEPDTRKGEHHKTHRAMGLYGLHPRNTTGTRFTLRDRPGVSVSDRGKRGPSGESNAPPIESLPSGCARGCFDGELPPGARVSFGLVMLAILQMLRLQPFPPVRGPQAVRCEP
jgi:hypothetical protein